MTHHRYELTLLVALSTVVASHGADAAPDFDRVVAPLLTRHCIDCHSGPKPKGRLDLTRKDRTFKGGKNGPAVVPGLLEESTLWKRVVDGDMPPKKRLSAEEQAVLKKWISAGARWGSDPIDPFRFTTDKRAGYDWWSLLPVRRPELPAVKNAAWPRGPIDRFILTTLEAKGLTPSPEAERRPLIRRLSFDLLGLPPAPQEVEAFVNSADPLAYEKLVDRYLASPHYGERWARHWLDVVRFGESNGFERDLPRPNAWPYRDWVVNALNGDVPYDEFVRLQLAGDVLRPDDPSALTATGFLVAGPHDTVVPAVERMRMAMQQDELEDILGTVGQTFLGLTVNCARCHDHKFDPISQKDYYRLVATLAGVQHGERSVKPLDRGELARLLGQQEELNRRLAVIDEPVRRRLVAERQKTGTKGTPPTALAEWDFTVDLRDRLGPLHATRFGEARLDGGLRLDGKTSYVATEPLTRDIKEKTLEAWVRLDQLKQQGSGVISLQTREGIRFDAIVFGEREAGCWMAGSDNFSRTDSFHGPVETQADREVTHVAITYHADGTISGYRNGQPYGKPYKSTGSLTFRAGEAQLVFGLRHAPSGSNKMLAGTLTRARLYDRALSAAEVAASAGVVTVQVSEAEILKDLSAEQRVQRQELAAQVQRVASAIERRRADLVTTVYAVVPQQPGPTHLLIRGNVGDLGEPTPPAGIASLPAAEWQLGQDAPEGQRRLRLAQWITDPKNPLLARVMVNRLWHYHFGAGLVETPNDFGFNGARPSHPELLDWLAAELNEKKWSLKTLHREILLSAAYRQASRPRAEARRIDANNRLLWCRSPQRLEAETVRDAMLAVCGKLDRTVGGRGYQDFKSYFFKGTQFYDPLEQVGPAFYRRSIYRMGARGGRSPFLDTFDCPDPSTTTPRRAVTTTPLQALTLLNNAFVLHTSEAFAERLRAEAGADVERQIRRAYELAYNRSANDREIALVRPFVAKHGLAALCRVIFNSNEFIYLE